MKPSRLARPLTAALAGAAAALAVLVPAGAAHAERYERVDPARDVVLSGPSGVTGAPTMTAIDVTRVTLDYTRTALRYGFKVRDLDAVGITRVGGTVRTSQGATFDVAATITRYRPEGTIQLFAGTTQVACSGMRVEVGYYANVVRLHVPSACLGTPYWLRTNAAMVRSSTTASTRFYGDDALRRGIARDGYFAFSPALRTT